MKKNIKPTNNNIEDIDPSNVTPTEEELLKDNEGIDILDIDDEDIDDEGPLDIDHLSDIEISDDDEDTIDPEIHNTEGKDLIQSDINVVVCPNCKEAVLESNLCSICGKPLRKLKVSDFDDMDEDEMPDVDLFNSNDENYLKDEIESSMDNDIIDIP
jgi:hypothetical protein